MLGGGAHSEPKREPVVESKRKPVVVAEHFSVGKSVSEPIGVAIVVAVVVAFGQSHSIAVNEPQRKPGRGAHLCAVTHSVAPADNIDRLGVLMFCGPQP